jgi:hypothetical protein
MREGLNAHENSFFSNRETLILKIKESYEKHKPKKRVKFFFLIFYLQLNKNIIINFINPLIL